MQVLFMAFGKKTNVASPGVALPRLPHRDLQVLSTCGCPEILSELSFDTPTPMGPDNAIFSGSQLSMKLLLFSYCWLQLSYGQNTH